MTSWGQQTGSPPGPGGSALRLLTRFAGAAMALAALSRAATVLHRGWVDHAARAAGADDASHDAVRDTLGVSRVLAAVTPNALLVAGVLFLVWLFQARTRVGLLRPHASRWGRGWTIGAWFVPVANLVLPPLVVADLVRATASLPAPTDRSGRPTTVVAAWWGCVLAAWVVDTVASGVRRDAVLDPRPATEVDGLLAAAVLHTVEAVLVLAAAGLIVLVMLRVSARLDPSGARRPPPAFLGGGDRSR